MQAPCRAGDQKFNFSGCRVFAFIENIPVHPSKIVFYMCVIYVPASFESADILNE